MKKRSIVDIRKAKGKRKLVCSTAYTYPMARILSDMELDLILVGDSLAMTIQGVSTTLSVKIEDIVYHTKAVTRGNKNSYVVADMPFLSTDLSREDSLRNAALLIQEGNADAVKIEGAGNKLQIISEIVKTGIPVMGHLGLTPQKILEMGGYKVQGKTKDSADKMIKAARELEEAGVFSIVLECIPAALANEITDALTIPTIGIGAGVNCDGQILVCDDLIGLKSSVSPAFVKSFGNVEEVIRNSLSAYKKEVIEGVFPGEEHSY